MTQKYPPLTRRDFLQLLGLTTTAAALTACGAPAAQEDTASTAAPEQTAGEPQPGGTLRVAFLAPVQGLDPAFMTRRADNQVALAIYECLVRTDQNLLPQPSLATAWEPADDLQSWTFTLREGVTFQHGTPFTAEDVVYTYERVLNPDLGASGRDMLSFLDSVEAVDDTTVRFNLNTPVVDLPLYVAHPFFAIVPHDRSSEQLASEPSGTGPFRLSEHRAGEQTSFMRNETYWDAPRPYLDELHFLSISEASTQVEALRSGTIDVIWKIGSEAVPVLEQSAEVRVIDIPGGAHFLFAMNASAPPFDDIRVRQAFKHCVDREGMIQAVLQGRGMVSNDQPVPPSDPNWADIAPLAYDPDRAKELLAEAGYADGLEVTLLTAEITPGMVAMAVAFQEMVKAAGVTITLDQRPVETYWSDVYSNSTSIYTSSWGMYDSPEMILALCYQSDSVYSETRWQNPELDTLIQAAQGEADAAQRKELYRQIQETISRDGAVIVPFFMPTLSAMRTNVQGLQPLPTDMLLFHDVWLTVSA